MITEIKPTFICPTCKRKYPDHDAAVKCANSDETPKWEVGQIVTFGDRFGWYDGERDWVTNPDIVPDMYASGRGYSLYYVITAITKDRWQNEYAHQLRYHVETMAMTGKKGYRGGYTSRSGHFTPRLVTNPPQIIQDQAKQLIGHKFDHLL